MKSRRGEAIHGDISDDDAAPATAMSGRTRNIHGRENRGSSNKTNVSRSYSKTRGNVPNNDVASTASAAAAANNPVEDITPQERICREREARERAREERMKEQEQHVLEQEQKRNGRSQLTITPQVLELAQGATSVGVRSHPVGSPALPKLQAARARVLVPT